MNVLLVVTTSVVMMALLCFSVPVAVRILETCPRYESTPRNAVKNITMYWLFRSEPAHVGVLHGGSIRTTSSCQCRPKTHDVRSLLLSTTTTHGDQGGTNAHGAMGSGGLATGPSGLATFTSFIQVCAQRWQRVTNHGYRLLSPNGFGYG
jgi:hypothetical protein